jgi:glycosyltransferase involved in cell wall biosynthesis
MHIGIDASRIAVATRTGTEHYTYELIAALAQQDQQTRYTLYCNQLPRSLPPLGPNFALRRIPLPRLWTHARLSAEVALHPPDVLFIPAHVLPLGAPLQRRTRSVVTIHDLGYLHFPAAHTRAQRLQLRLSTLWSARAASHLIAISAATRDDLVRFTGISPTKVSVVHHGVSPRFRPVEDRTQIAAVRARYGITENYVFYVGTIQPRKNLLRLIEAFAQALPDAPSGLQFVIAGKRGWLSEAIERRAAELGVAERVRFIGYADDDDLPALISGALAFVFPSLYEGFGMPVLEAMACGTPVLTSTTSSLPEVAGDAALLVPPDDTAAIAAGLRHLFAEGRLRTELRERGLRHAAQFTWERCAAQTRAILASMVSDVSQPRA